jgi:hypothetical protein
VRTHDPSAIVGLGGVIDTYYMLFASGPDGVFHEHYNPDGNTQ